MGEKTSHILRMLQVYIYGDDSWRFSRYEDTFICEHEDCHHFI